jgi:membrane protein YdbS with pleckstrin-like domain
MTSGAVNDPPDLGRYQDETGGGSGPLGPGRGTGSVPTAMILPDPRFRISRSAVWYWTVRNVAVLAVVVIVVAVPTVLLPIGAGPRRTVLVLTTVIAVVLVGLIVGLSLWRYAVHRWEVTDTFIITRAGAVFRDWRIVPLHRVQTVEVSQSILERIFGVARLVIRTASYSGSTDIVGMDADQARQAAARLTEALTGHVRSGRTDDGA